MTSSPNSPDSSPHGASTTAPHFESKHNTPGRISLIVGVVIMLVGALFIVVQPLVLFSDSRELLPVIGLISAITQIGLALVGLAFGIIGAVSRDTRKLTAGIGIGICASALFSIVVSLLSSALLYTL